MEAIMSENVIAAIEATAEQLANPLVHTALKDKRDAIQQYESIIWKVRSGYILILYGALTLVLGRQGVPDICVLLHSSGNSLALFSLIVGLSVSVFLLDRGYVCKRLKIVAARDRLIDLVCKCEPEHKGQVKAGTASNNDEKKADIFSLLHVAGETAPEDLPKGVGLDYESKLRWNEWRILLPIYLTTPVLAILMFLLCRFVM
jgi:hypothetical protein